MRGLSSALALLLCGCAADLPLEWTKAGAVRGQLETDIFICRQWSDWSTPGKVDPADFEQCMVATGWTPLAPNSSPSSVVASR